jgi:hypothetical protein
MATQTKLWQLENSLTAGSILVTDVNNENVHFSPGTLGQFLRVGASGLPEWNTFSVPSEYEQVATPAALPVTGNPDVIYLVADRGDGQPEFQVWTGTAYLAVPTNPILNFNLVGQAGSPQSINQGENINFSGLNGFSMSVGATNAVYVNPPVGTATNQVMGWNNTTNVWEVQTLQPRPFYKLNNNQYPTALDYVDFNDDIVHNGSVIIGNAQQVNISNVSSPSNASYFTTDAQSSMTINSVANSFVGGSGMDLDTVFTSLILQAGTSSSTTYDIISGSIISNINTGVFAYNNINNSQIFISDMSLSNLNNVFISGKSGSVVSSFTNDSFNIVGFTEPIVKFDYDNVLHYIGTQNSQVLIGETSVTSVANERLTIKSKSGLSSGLVFEDLNSLSSPTSETSYLAVDSDGLVVKGAAVTSVPNGIVTGQQLIWNGTAWVVYQDRSETFTGITIATVTLANTPKVGTFPDVYLNGIFQTEGGVDYTIAGAVITFGAALVASDRVSVRYKS